MASFQVKLKLIIPIFVGVFVIVNAFSGYPALSVNLRDSDITLHLSAEVIPRGYTIIKPDGLMKLAINPYVLDIPADVSLKSMTQEGLTMPQDLNLVSDILEYDIRTDPIKIFAKDLVIVMKYRSDNLKTKKIYFYDSINIKWRPLFSETNVVDKSVRAYAHLPYSKVAVFESDDSYEGYASWYRSYRYPSGCASNDYPLDTRLRVTNLDNKKTVICQVKSTGPFVANRIIDLSSTAFKAIAETWEGTAKVHVEAADVAASVNSAAPVALNPQVQGLAAPLVNAPVAMIYDAENKKVIYEKNSYVKQNVASITKLMTALVFLETNPDFEKVVTIDESDWPRPEAGVTIAVAPGDQITVRDLFNAMITGSANNAAYALARSTGLTRDEFVKKMNKKAVILDMMSTHFVDPSGITVGNISTTTDIALLTNYIMKRPGVRYASIRGDYTYTIINKSENRTIHNPVYLYTNTLANVPMVAAKTGYINESGYCLVAKARTGDGREFVAVILNSPTVYTRASDAKNLIEYGLKVF
ncbi:MAG: RlpA-like double-psi beta-barrel domain-containing protein [Patescibacteria group bacterium]